MYVAPWTTDGLRSKSIFFLPERSYFKVDHLQSIIVIPRTFFFCILVAFLRRVLNRRILQLLQFVRYS